MTNHYRPATIMIPEWGDTLSVIKADIIKNTRHFLVRLFNAYFTATIKYWSAYRHVPFPSWTTEKKRS